MNRPPAPFVYRADADAIRDLDHRLSKLAQTEFGLGERFQIRHGHLFRYVEAWKKWLFFNGRRWVRDDGAAHRYAHATILALRREALQLEPPNDHPENP